ncbi:spore germination protein [Gracilibacillus sp. S3-1-1]|uniref:Spore germination protein n=1 Tax=Gracilibacillus pellucidus TaxID=3095368 RepID=A0ACC6M4D1_9BACI|nr:spore germination protein [Gracilibacillus sp. S3-1-1]MDX8045761.1 spore germination protein [Gracilibacillus sp. S3-1-1]
MPAIVGAVKVINLSSSSIFHIGDVYKIEPYTQSKTFAGGGSFNTGNEMRIHMVNAQTHMVDNDQFDQNITGIW